MKDLYKNMNTFMVRTPTFQANKYFNFFDNNIDLNNLKDRLFEICSNPDFREAILVSSRTLYNTLIDFCNGKEIKKFDYFVQSIYKYLIRMSIRPTPFGLFSGVDFGEYTDEETSFLYNDNKFEKFARPDLEWIISIVKDLEENYFSYLTFKINDGIFIKGNRALLIHSTLKEDNNRIGEISVRATKPFMRTYELAKDCVEYGKLKHMLLEEYSNADEKTIEGFLKQLIEKEYLISNLRPPLTGLDQFDYIINELKKFEIQIPIISDLIDIKNEIDSYNKSLFGKGEEAYLKLCKKMKDVSNVKNLLQVDTKLNLKEKKINKKIISEINDLMNILFRLSMAIDNPEPFLSRYKQEFVEKYGQDREISLLELLDNDTGIGGPFNYERPSNNRSLDIAITKSVNGNVRDYFSEKYLYAIKNKENSIVIKDNEVKDLEIEEINYENIPDSLEVNIIIKSQTNENNDISLKYNIGPNLGSTSAGKSFGRFSHMMDNPSNFFKSLNAEIKNLKNMDEYVTCEISYLPNEVRNANVTRNIHESDYEISLFTNGRKDNISRLKLDDIFIGIENNQFYAKSKTLNKKLLITMNNMLNPQAAPNAIRFLYDISLEGKKLWYDFPWNDVYKNFSYVPAIKYKNFTICPETWRLNRINMKITKKTEFNEFREMFKNYCSQYNVPKYVYLTFADNRILLNIENEECIKILFHECKNTFQEIVLNAYECEGSNIVKNGDCDYACELVIPLIKVKKDEIIQTKFSKKLNNISSLSSNRIKDPFDEWIYLKLYGTSSSADDLIAYSISEYCNNLVKNKNIDKYFFMRYVDPEQHIRLRLNGEENKLLEIYPDLRKWLNSLKEEGLMTHFSLDSYDREIERYGGLELIDIAEKVFYFDSLVTENILIQKREGNITFSNELIGIISEIHYMESFGIKYEEQVNYLRSQVSQSDYRDDFKKNRREYMKLCNSNENWKGLRERDSGALLLTILNIRHEIVRCYGIKVRENLLSSTDLSILDSVIHLHFNRLFGIDREFEKKVRALASHCLYALKHFKI